MVLHHYNQKKYIILNTTGNFKPFKNMKIIRVSPFSGKTNVREIDVTEEQIKLWEGGELIQNAMPNVSPGDREFIKSGITDEEWNETFGE